MIAYTKDTDNFYLIQSLFIQWLHSLTTTDVTASSAASSSSQAQDQTASSDVRHAQGSTGGLERTHYMSPNLTVEQQRMLLELATYNPIDFLRLPSRDGLFVVNDAPTAMSNFLVETNPDFIEFDNFLGSEFLLEELNVDPDEVTQRLGDAFYETRLVRDAIQASTGQRYLTDPATEQRIASDVEQMQYLYSNAVAAEKELQLSLGVALTAEQVARLTHDILWLVEQTVTLNDGAIRTVLAPVFYASALREGDVIASGAVLSGDTIDLETGHFSNNGLLDTQTAGSIRTSESLLNTGVVRSGGDVDLASDGDVTNRGSIDSEGVTRVRAENDLDNSLGSINGVFTAVTSGRNLDNSGGTIGGDTTLVDAGGDIDNRNGSISGTNTKVTASGDIDNRGGRLQGSDRGSLSVAASGAIDNRGGLFNSGTNGRVMLISRGGTLDNRDGTIAGGDVTAVAGSVGGSGSIDNSSGTIRSTGNLTLVAEDDILNSNGADLGSITSKGNAALIARTGDIVNQANVVSWGNDANGGSRVSDAPELSPGGSLLLDAGNDILIRAADVNAGGSASLIAGNDVVVEAAANSSNSERTWHRNQEINRSIEHVSSSVTAGGNVNIAAGNDLSIIGSQVNGTGKCQERCPLK